MAQELDEDQREEFDADYDEEELNFDNIKGDDSSDEMGDEEYNKLLAIADGEEGAEGDMQQEVQDLEEEQDDVEEDEEDQEDDVFNDLRETELQIKAAEEKIMTEKPWQMKGEVRGQDRPVNSLLNVEVEFQHGLRLKEQKEEVVHQNMETMIRQRILNEAFDDPKMFTFNNNLDQRQLTDVDFEKDKKGLAAYYEEDYKRRMLGLPAESKEDKMKSEILDQFKELMSHLDHMTNMTFTPMGIHKKIKKKKTKDIEVIQLEEKVPITVKEMDTINPKDLFQTNAKEYVGANEATSADNQRKRRIVKRKIRAKLKQQRKKDLARDLEHKGQSKYEYNLVNRAKKRVEQEHENSGVKMNNLTRSSQFFKLIQANQDADPNEGAKSKAKQKKKLQRASKL